MLTSSARRSVALLLAAAVGIFALSGCGPIAVTAVQAVYGDPRAKVRDYDMRVEVSFRAGDATVHATQYGEVFHFDGKGERQYQTCSKSNKSCWAITPEYFIALPNGDIANVHLEARNLPLSEMSPGDSKQVKGLLFGILRTRSAAGGKGPSCGYLSEAETVSLYGIPARLHAYEMYSLDIDIVATRAENGRYPVIDPEDVYELERDHTCEQIAGRIPVGRVTP